MLLYEQVIEYIQSTVPQFSTKGGQAYHKGFEKINALMSVLGHPEKDLKCIHVAGTNGKGSVCTLLAAYLQSQGLKVGLHTSPHILDLRERFLINNKQIAKESIVDFIEKYKDTIASIKPSFFELTVAMAFYYFHEYKVDIAVIETGLGGRFDSTNILNSMLSVITNVSKDHLSILGRDLTSIAFEKAGIIKENTPVILGLPENEIVNKVIEKEALSKNAPLFKTSELPSEASQEILEIGKKLSLPYFQLLNVQTVYQSLLAIPNLQVRTDLSTYVDFLKNYFKANSIPGRWQILQENPRIILDVGHNEAALMMQQKELENYPKTNLHILIGFMSDKEVDDLLHYFPKEAHYYFTQANIERALSSETLQLKAKNHELYGEVYISPQQVWKAIKDQLDPKDTLLVTGSFFIIESFLKAYQETNSKSPK